jgi:hypothetical protein
MKPVKELPSALSERVGGQEYLWCRRCSRTFVLDEAMLDEASFAKAVALLEQQSDAGRLSNALTGRLHCPHNKCGAPLDTVTWELIRAEHSEYPQEPVSGDEYPAD